jgi:hypothetical protein
LRSLAAAAAAARAWAPSGGQPSTASSIAALGCYAWQTSGGGQCATFCSDQSYAPGLGKVLSGGAGCAVPSGFGDSTAFTWQ